jgi:hypothetical protein
MVGETPPFTYRENGMAKELLKICIAENGYTIEVYGRMKDSEPPKKNEYGSVPWKEPETHVAKSLGETLKFVADMLPNLVPYDADEEYGMSFDKAVKEND